MFLKSVCVFLVDKFVSDIHYQDVNSLDFALIQWKKMTFFFFPSVTKGKRVGGVGGARTRLSYCALSSSWESVYG